MDKVGSIFLTGEAQRGHRFCTPLKWCFVKCNKTPLNRVPLCVCLMKSDYPLYPFYVAIFLCNINIRACVNEWNAFMRPRVSASECAWGVSARLCVREWVRACVVRGWVRFGVSACMRAWGSECVLEWVRACACVIGDYCAHTASSTMIKSGITR